MRVETAIVHFQTPDLLRQTVDSFCAHCPGERVLIVDNGSKDGSTSVVEALAAEHSPVEVRMLAENIYHGPAMDLVLQETKAEVVFFLDSDTVTHRGGFIEPMVALLEAPGVLASGQVATVDGRGFAASSGIPVPVSAFMAIQVERYRRLPPFRHHGLPVLETCRRAAELGLEIAPFPIEQYVEHLGRGTAERFGYGLGWKSRLSYLLHRLGL